MLSITELQKKLKKQLKDMDYITVFLSGSKSFGLAHDLSDTDVMLLSNSTETKTVNYSEYELKIISISEIENAVNEILESKRLNLNSQILLSEIYHGMPIINHKALEQIKRKISWSAIIQNMVVDRLRGYKFYKQDGIKFYETQDISSARFCFQRAVENLIDAYLFLNRQLIVKDKWRLKSFRNVDNQLFNEVIKLYSELWSTVDLQMILNEYENCCNKIFQLIQEKEIYE